MKKLWFKHLTGNKFYSLKIDFSNIERVFFHFSNTQLESSSEARSALENQLERLTRDKVCVDRFCLFIFSRFFSVQKFRFIVDLVLFFYARSTSWLNWSRQKVR